MKKVILHVGPPKTGTSVLQKWLNSNRTFLAKNGISYPEHRLDANGVSSGNKDIFLIKNEKEGTLQFDVGKYERLLKSLQASKFQTLLLSSEFFFSHIPSFVKHSRDVKISFVAYVRPEHEFVESIYNQSVKRNKQTNPIALRHTLPSSYLDRLIEYIDNYGADLFHLRGYGAEGFFQNGIIPDFCNAIGIKHDVSVEEDEKINGSYNFECMEFKRWTNKFFLGALDNQLDMHLQAYNQGISNYTIIPSLAHSRYKDQTKAKIDEINKRASIVNIDALRKYIETKERRGYYHQELQLRHVEYVSKFIAERDSVFLKNLVTHISREAKLSYDVERLKVINDVLINSKITRKRISSFQEFTRKILAIFK